METFQLKKDKKIFIEADEMWAYVGSKENDMWIWPALERRTGLVVGCHVGNIDDAGDSSLWDYLSEDCKKNGIYFLRTACPLAEKYFQQTDAELSSKEAGKQVISRGLI